MHIQQGRPALTQGWMRFACQFLQQQSCLPSNVPPGTFSGHGWSSLSLSCKPHPAKEAQNTPMPCLSAQQRHLPVSRLNDSLTAIGLMSGEHPFFSLLNYHLQETLRWMGTCLPWCKKINNIPEQGANGWGCQQHQAGAEHGALRGLLLFL